MRAESFGYNMGVCLVMLQSWLQLERPGATSNMAVICGKAIKMETGLGRMHKLSSSSTSEERTENRPQEQKMLVFCKRHAVKPLATR